MEAIVTISLEKYKELKNKLTTVNKLKRLSVGLFLAVVLIGCSAESRIKNYSYTEKWYYIDNLRFQVYQTKFGREYILILNDRETKFVRQYVEPQNTYFR
jgi:hypothetical protein